MTHWKTVWPTDWLPPLDKILEKLLFSHLLKSPSHSWPIRFITVFTRIQFLVIMRKIIAFHVIPSYFSEDHFNVILSYTTKTSKWSLSGFCTKVLYAFQLCRYKPLPSPSHAPGSDRCNIWWATQITKLPLMKVSAVSRYFHSHRSLYLPQRFVFWTAEPSFNWQESYRGGKVLTQWGRR